MSWVVLLSVKAKMDFSRLNSEFSLNPDSLEFALRPLRMIIWFLQ